jgi:hypothetical protein
VRASRSHAAGAAAGQTWWSPASRSACRSSPGGVSAAQRSIYLTKPVDPAPLLEKAGALIAVTRDRRAKGQEVVLAVGAHPDDVEIGVGRSSCATSHRATGSRSCASRAASRAASARTAPASRGAPPTCSRPGLCTPTSRTRA